MDTPTATEPTRTSLEAATIDGPSILFDSNHHLFIFSPERGERSVCHTLRICAILPSIPKECTLPIGRLPEVGDWKRTRQRRSTPYFQRHGVPKPLTRTHTHIQRHTQREGELNETSSDAQNRIIHRVFRYWALGSLSRRQLCSFYFWQIFASCDISLCPVRGMRSLL